MTNIKLIKIFIIIHLDNTIKYIILTILQQNTLKINLNKKQKKNLQLKKQIDLKLLKRHKNYLKIQI